MGLFILNLLCVWVHPFYVSVTEIQHNPVHKTLEISIRVFTDDFENALRMQHPNRKIDLINPTAGSVIDSLVKYYFIQKMKLEVNGQNKTMNYVGFEHIEESVWGYFEVVDIPVLKELKIFNPILYEYKKEQINMVHVRSANQQQSRKLDNPEANWTFRF